MDSCYACRQSFTSSAGLDSLSISNSMLHKRRFTGYRTSPYLRVHPDRASRQESELTPEGILDHMPRNGM